MLSHDEIREFVSGKAAFRLLALDIDGCAWLGEHSIREDGLNQGLIDIAPHYDALVFITHRAYWMYQLELFRSQMTAQSGWRTERVVEKFTTITALPCLGVSSPDDEGTHVGQAYRGVMEEQPFQATPIWHMPRHYLSKSPQLAQIIGSILAHNDAIHLTIDYHDDRRYLLASANAMELPPNIEVNCFQTINETIIPLPKSENSRCSCQLL